MPPESPTDACYWTEVARTVDPAAGSLSGGVEVDVAIIGGGIVGIVAARLLKDDGRRVAVVEGGRAGFGVTGRSTAKVTAQHGVYLQRIERDHGAEAARTYAQANRAGVELVGELTQRHGLSCDLEPADSWVYATSDDGVRQLHDERAAAERAGLPMELVEQVELPYPVRAGLRLPDQRQFQPADFVAQLAATIPGDGSCLFERSVAVDWSEKEIHTSAGCVRAAQVIMATHLPLGQVGQYHAHNSPHMHVVMAVPVDPARAPTGMYISVDEPKRSLRSHRNAAGETMLILTGPTYKHGDAAAEQRGFAALEDFAREHFGYAGGGYRWTNEDYSPRDGLPYVGWSGSAAESILVATGFDAWGLSNGAAAGRLLADLCEGKDNPWAGCFDASRHSLGGLGKLATQGAQFVRELVGEHAHKPPPAASAVAGEGDVVDVGGRAAGLYRSGGALKAVSAVCTHMGCLVGWNPVDRTWDCPCHGSRFAEDGRVVHGPATEPLHELAWSDDQKRG
jgi:glycine/D-amino acid oxidase-like deaminating enzyme/nitrite reductase/ring-hydroxylating ferredoxin subunit